MASIQLSQFKENLNDFARPNRFLLTIGAIGGITDINFGENYQYLVNATSLPGIDFGEIAVDWFGVKHKFHGDPTYTDFTVTFINDIGFTMRHQIEKWMDKIATVGQDAKNVRSPNGTQDTLDFHDTIITVSQIGNEDMNEIKKVELHGCWPNSITEIGLDSSSRDEIQTYDVTFSYDYWIDA